MASVEVRRRASGLEWWIIGASAAWVGGILLVPLFVMVAGVVTRPLEVLAQLADAEALDALFRTAWVTVVAVVSGAVVGVAGGVVLARHQFRGKWLLDAVVDLPLAVSPVMIGLGFLLLVGRTSPLGAVLDQAGIKIAFAWPAVLIGTTFVTLPFTVREVALVLREAGTSEEEAAGTLGASPLQTFFWVTLPKLRHGIESGALLTAARSLGEFGAVLVLGGAVSMRTQTATTWIHAALDERKEAGAYGVSLLLVAATVALVGLRGRLAAKRGAGGH